MLALLFYDAHAAAGGAALPPSILAGALIYGWLPCALLGGKWNGDVRHGNGTHAAGEEQRWRRSHWIRLFAAVAAFWLPLAARAVHGLPMPVLARGGPQPGSTLDLTPILAVELALLLFAGVRRLGRIGYTFRLSRRDLAVALVALAAFAAVAVPLGMGIGFLRYAPRPLRAEEIALRFLGIYVFVAVPEELLFRGLLQNLIERALARREEAEEGSRVRSRSSGPASLLIASLLFGAAHLQHAPAPNYRYFLLASLAGVAYGEVWRRTGKITASALTHAAVDLIWVLLLGA
jgi:membrane protease YdiL (CAAX protease family)